MGQWGDASTLVALSGVLGKMWYTITTGFDTREKKAYIETRSHCVPAEWGLPAPDPLPVLLFHSVGNHFCPVRVDREGEWGWLMPGVDERLAIRVRDEDSRQRDKRWRKRRRKEWKEELRLDEGAEEWRGADELDGAAARRSPCLDRNSFSTQRPEEGSWGSACQGKGVEDGDVLLLESPFVFGVDEEAEECRVRDQLDSVAARLSPCLARNFCSSQRPEEGSWGSACQGEGVEDNDLESPMRTEVVTMECDVT